jgi:pimeloyl-ACP methyl ester carboxylesterase
MTGHSVSSTDDDGEAGSINDSPPIEVASIVGTRQPSLDRWIRMQEQFLELTRKFASDPFAPSPLEAVSTTIGMDGARRISDEVVVYVHGISQHRAGYSNPWWSALQPHLTRPIAKEEVLWSDLVNPRGGVRALEKTAELAKLQKLRAELDNELRQRAERLERTTAATRPAGRSLHVAPRGDGFSSDDFLRYMAFESTREAILARFDAVAKRSLNQGKTLHIIAHSWGTVVAYEGLRRLDANGIPGRVANLFLLGSALSIGAVQRNLFSRVHDGRRPHCVQRIVNVDAAGDIVGGSIALDFVVDAEHLAVPPVGCTLIPFTSTPWSPACAHTSYFRRENVAVQREIIAGRIAP